MSTPPIVIIAEPDPMISSALRVEFTHLDFAVFLAASGQEADEYAAYTVAQLVVIDAGLRVGPYEACARIRRREGYAALADRHHYQRSVRPYQRCSRQGRGDRGTGEAVPSATCSAR